MRLNRYLASCGLGSRRGVEPLVLEGRVKVNGKVCRNLGTRVGPGDEVRVDGRLVESASHCTIAYHKTRGLVCSRSDELGRNTIYDQLPNRFRPLAHVGRLDRDSEGLLLLTNDGDLSNRLGRPGAEIEKEYLVTLDRAFDPADRSSLLQGIEIETGLAKAVAVDVASPRRPRLVLHQGLKRQIRLMLEALGYRVKKLVRTRIGGLALEGLGPGKWCTLDGRDLAKLTKNPRKPARRGTRKRRTRGSQRSPRRRRPRRS